MTIWVLLWLVLSAIILGASVWSMLILFRQKKAWQEFSVKHSMTYAAGRFMGPPTLDGFIDKYRVSFFTAERQSPDVRTRRFVTVVEIVFPEGVINGAALGTTEMVPFMESLSNLSPMPITHEKWDASYRAFARNRDAVRMYLTPARLDHVIQLLSTRNADVIVIFDENQGVVRVETSDPILDPVKAEKVILRLIKHSQGLRISKQERAEIMERAAADETLPEPTPEETANKDEPPAAPDDNSASI